MVILTGTGDNSAGTISVELPEGIVCFELGPSVWLDEGARSEGADDVTTATSKGGLESWSSSSRRTISEGGFESGSEVSVSALGACASGEIPAFSANSMIRRACIINPTT